MSTRDYEFTLLLDYPGDYEAAENAIFEAGCDDALMGLRHGCIVLDFCREAESLLDAIATAMSDVGKARLCVGCAESGNLKCRCLSRICSAC